MVLAILYALVKAPLRHSIFALIFLALTLENPAEAERLAKNFRTEIQESLTWEHHYAAYRRVYLQSLR